MQSATALMDGARRSLRYGCVALVWLSTMWQAPTVDADLLRVRVVQCRPQFLPLRRNLQDVLHHYQGAQADCLSGTGQQKKYGHCDICFISVYWMLPPQIAAEWKWATKLMQWLEDLLASLPERCTPVLCMDGNFHCGLEKMGERWCLGDPADAVGQNGAERENGIASRMRTVLNKHFMALANSHFANGRESTFFMGTAHTRVDYIGLPKQQMRHWLQLSATHCNLVHVPLVMDFEHRPRRVSEPRQRLNGDSVVNGGATQACVF